MRDEIEGAVLAFVQDIDQTTTGQVLKALQLPTERPAQMLVADILKKHQWRRLQVSIHNKRVWVYRRIWMPAKNAEWPPIAVSDAMRKAGASILNNDLGSVSAEHVAEDVFVAMSAVRRAEALRPGPIRRK